MTEKIELLPCPFCGIELYECEYDGGKIRHAHEANGCLLGRRFVYPKERETWNTRASLASAAEPVAGINDHEKPRYTTRRLRHEIDQAAKAKLQEAIDITQDYQRDAEPNGQYWQACEDLIERFRSAILTSDT